MFGKSLNKIYRFIYIYDMSVEWNLYLFTIYIILYTRYPIVARRAWPAGCSAFRPSASREQRYLAYKGQVREDMQPAGQARRATIGYLVYKLDLKADCSFTSEGICAEHFYT